MNPMPDPVLPDAVALAARVRAVVIGGSAGCLEVLREILPSPHGRLPLPILIVVHLPEDSPALLHRVLGPRGTLRLKQAEDKEWIEAGCIYFAPGGYHLLVERDQALALSVDEPVHFSRPAIDVLFESAADAYGAGLMALLLTGASQDGAAGLRAVAQAGGLTVVQDPASARVPYMPAMALRSSTPDYVLAPAQIRELLARLESPPQPPPG